MKIVDKNNIVPIDNKEVSISGPALLFVLAFYYTFFYLFLISIA
jgi:hypothetical protein